MKASTEFFKSNASLQIESYFFLVRSIRFHSFLLISISLLSPQGFDSKVKQVKR